MNSPASNVVFEKLFKWAIPAPFIIIQSLWLIVYFLRLGGSPADFLVYGVRLFYALFSAFIAYNIFTKYRSNVNYNLFGSVVFVICFSYVILFSISFFNMGLTSTLKSVVMQFFVNSVPAIIIGAYCATFHLGRDFLKKIELSGIIFAPASIIYVSRFFLYKQNIYIFDLLRIGKLDYMIFSYALLPLMICSVLLALSEQRRDYMRTLRIFMSCIYFVAILFTQTRGAFIGAICGMSFIYIFHFRNNKITLLFISLIYVFISVIIVQYTLPRLLGDYNVRFSQNYLEESLNLKSGNASSLNSSAAKLFRDNIGSGILIDESKNICTVINTQIAEKLATDDQFYRDFSEIGCNVKLSRMSLIVTSLKEIERSPFLGMGPLAYMEKYYGFHPHNIILELLTELGIIFGSAIALLLAGIFTFLIFRAPAGSGDQSVAIMLSSFVPMFMVSGTFWGDAVLSFFMAYASVFALRYRFRYGALDLERSRSVSGDRKI